MTLPGDREPQENLPVENPLENQRDQALAHYEELATQAHHWSSVVPRAIREHFDRRIAERDAPPPTSGEPIDENWVVEFSGGCCDGLEVRWPRLRAEVTMDGPPNPRSGDTRDHYVLRAANGLVRTAFYIIEGGAPPTEGRSGP